MIIVTSSANLFLYMSGQSVEIGKLKVANCQDPCGIYQQLYFIIIIVSQYSNYTAEILDQSVHILELLTYHELCD